MDQNEKQPDMLPSMPPEVRGRMVHDQLARFIDGAPMPTEPGTIPDAAQTWLAGHLAPGGDGSMKWPKGPYTVKQGIRGYRFTVVDREGSAIADVPEVLLVEHDARAVANLLCAAPDLVEAIEVAHACGEPHKKSLYDEEGVEGWRWQHPDGREWSVMGDWREDPPMHPMLEDALAKARGEN